MGLSYGLTPDSGAALVLSWVHFQIFLSFHGLDCLNWFGSTQHVYAAMHQADNILDLLIVWSVNGFLSDVSEILNPG